LTRKKFVFSTFAICRYGARVGVGIGV